MILGSSRVTASGRRSRPSARFQGLLDSLIEFLHGVFLRQKIAVPDSSLAVWLSIPALTDKPITTGSGAGNLI